MECRILHEKMDRLTELEERVLQEKLSGERKRSKRILTKARIALAERDRIKQELIDRMPERFRTTEPGTSQLEGDAQKPAKKQNLPQGKQDPEGPGPPRGRGRQLGRRAFQAGQGSQQV